MTEERRFMVYYRRKNKNVGDAVTPQPIIAKDKNNACREIKRRHKEYNFNRLFAVEMVRTLDTPVIDGPLEIGIPAGGLKDIQPIGVADMVVTDV